MRCIAVLICCRSLISCSAKCFSTECSINQVKAKKASIEERLIKKVSRRAREKGRPGSLTRIRYLQHIAHAAHRLDQLRFKIVIDFRAKPFYRHINRVCVAVKIHVPHLGGNQGAG